MEKNQSSNTFEQKVEKLTLKGYYQKLPIRNAPRYDFISEVASRCHVTLNTVRNWILYGIKPQQRCHVEILSELTGIKENDLWAD